MPKPMITVLHDVDGIFKVYQSGPNFVKINPETFIPNDSMVCYTELDPREFLAKWPKSRYDYEVVGAGRAESTHSVAPISTQEISKYFPNFKQESVKQIQSGVPEMHYQPNEVQSTPPQAEATFKQDAINTGTHRLIMVYTKLCAKLGGLKGKQKEILAAEIRGFKNGVLLVDATLNDLLMDIESEN